MIHIPVEMYNITCFVCGKFNFVTKYWSPCQQHPFCDAICSTKWFAKQKQEKNMDEMVALNQAMGFYDVDKTEEINDTKRIIYGSMIFGTTSGKKND